MKPKLDSASAPLAARLRPRNLDEFTGQDHLLQKGKPLRQAIEQGVLHSMILWGPPGTGKTTLAQLIAQSAHTPLRKLSAVFSGVKEIRAIAQEAQSLKNQQSQKVILFVDEIHRFSKSQQDAFLPFVEDGTFILIGATTENPSFEINKALLSRARVYVLKPLTETELDAILSHALADPERGLGRLNIYFPDSLRKIILQAADGDARQLLNLLEIIADFAPLEADKQIVTEQLLAEVLQVSLRQFDKGGEIFYQQISALHKAMRGSAPDAALYWFGRMIDGGSDPRYIGRRLIRFASEDIGNADPRALQLTLNACETYERLGSPEGELALAQAVLYLSVAPKSNAVYMAWKAGLQDAKQFGSLAVPSHLCNAPTESNQQLGHGKNYRYPHDEANGYAAGENYFPQAMTPRIYYRPVHRGLEIQIKERLAELTLLDAKKKSSPQAD